MTEENLQEKTMDEESEAPKKILVVDDQAVNVEFLRKMISKWGYDVITAYRGIQALKEAQENKPDLILLDVIMPDLTGYEVCRGLKVRSETAEIPVIFLTAKGEIFDRIEGLNMGAHDYVAKPFHPDELKARIITALRYKEERERLKQETDQLKALTIIDEVTSFYNRRYLEERINEELSRAQRYHYTISLALVSPNGFDEVRKKYSQARGDSIVKQIGEIMKRNIRAIDIVTRFGDDTFAILLPQTGTEGARVFGEKVMKIVDRHLFHGIPDKTKLSISVGIATFRKFNLKDKDTLMAEAEKSLNSARNEASHICVVDL